MTRPRTDTDLVFTIAPGRFDRARDIVNNGRATEAAQVDGMIGTEATDNRVDLPDFNVTQGPGREGESYIATSCARFQLVKGWVEQITTGRGKGRFKHPTTVPVQINLDLVTGYLMIIIGIHLRAHLWKGSKRWHPGNLASWWQGVRSIRRLRRQLRRDYPGAAMLVVGDPNATHRRWFQAAIRRTFRKATVIWGGPFSTGWAWGLKAVQMQTVNPRGASDHPWKRVTLRYLRGVVRSAR